MIHTIESKFGRSLQDVIACFKQSLSVTVSERKELMAKFSSFVESIEKDIRRMDEKREVLADLERATLLSDDPNQKEHREVALLSKLSHFIKLSDESRPLDHVFHVHALKEGQIQKGNIISQPVSTDSTPNQFADKPQFRGDTEHSNDPDCKDNHHNFNLFVIEKPIFLIAAFPLLSRKPLKLGSSVNFDVSPFQFWFTTAFIKTTDETSKVLEISAHCRLSCENDPCPFKCNCATGAFNYTFCMRNLFNYKKDISKSGVWKSPWENQPLSWCCPLTSESLGNPRNGWTVKQKNQNEYVEISFTLRPVPKYSSHHH